MEKIGSEAAIEGEGNKEFGKNVHAVLEFLRHATPGKTPEGMSADFLTEGGQEMARGMGKARVQEEKIAGYSSPAKRAQETGDLYLDNTDESVEVVNRTIAETKAKYPAQKEGNIFRMKTKQELAPTVGFAKIMPLAKEFAKTQKAAGSKADDLTLIIQYYLDNPEKCRELGVDLPYDAASQIAHRVATELNMTERFREDTDVRLINVTHGPKLEPFLKEVVGFGRLEEIGGAMKEGENLQFVVDIDGNGSKNVTLIFRGRNYELTEEQTRLITEMSDYYKAYCLPKEHYAGMKDEKLYAVFEQACLDYSNEDKGIDVANRNRRNFMFILDELKKRKKTYKDVGLSTEAADAYYQIAATYKIGSGEELWS